MKIVEALQCEPLRITCRSRWLYGSTWGDWTVRERLYGAKKTTLILVTKNEDEAVEALISNPVETPPACSSQRGEQDGQHYLAR